MSTGDAVLVFGYLLGVTALLFATWSFSRPLPESAVDWSYGAGGFVRIDRATGEIQLLIYDEWVSYGCDGLGDA